jgi:hypothetical protein
MASPQIPTGFLQVGPLRLKCPPKCELLSTSQDPREAGNGLVLGSPDHTVYHRRPYLEFIRESGCPAEMIAVVKNGELVFGMPVHPSRPAVLIRVSTGYSSPRIPRKESSNARLPRCSNSSI